MKRLLSLALALMLALSLISAHADNDRHPKEGMLPLLTVAESKAITDNPYAALYDKSYKSTINYRERASEFYANIDVLLQLSAQSSALVYDAIDDQFEFEEDLFVKDGKLLAEDWFALEDLLNRFNLLLAEAARRGMVSPDINRVLPPNLMDPNRIIGTAVAADSNPLGKIDSTTLYNNLALTLYLIEEKDFIEDEQARALLQYITIK